MDKSLWNGFAFLSFTTALVSGVMAMLAAGIGIQEYLPAAYKVNLIDISWMAAFVYAIIQVVQGLTPPGSTGFERLAKAGSWIALLMFIATLAVMTLQLGVNFGNVRAMMETSSPFKLVVMLLVFAIFDVMILPWFKKQIYGTGAASHVHVTPTEIAHHDVHAASVPPALQLIGHAEKVYYFDCRGKDIKVTPSPVDGEPTVEVIEPPRAA